MAVLNARLSNIISEFPVLSIRLRHRILYDVVCCMLEKPELAEGVTPQEVALDFGLRARLLVEEISYPVNKIRHLAGELFLALGLGNSYSYDSLNLSYMSQRFREITFFEQDNDQGPSEDLDHEADAFNVAYLWSGLAEDEPRDVTAVRRHLYMLLLYPAERASTGADLLAKVLRLDASPMRQLFFGVACLEGLGCSANVEDAEKYFGSISHLRSRTGILATYYIARIKVEKHQTCAREYMLALANQGNLFAQVYISRAFASGPELGCYTDMKFNELGYFIKIASTTGYAVSQVLAPLYGHLLIEKEKLLLCGQTELSVELQNLARKSAESGNVIGRAIWGTSYQQLPMNFSRPEEYLVSGALCCLSNNLEKAKDWFERAETGIGFALVNMLLESDPHAKASWLTCMDYCYESEVAANSVWFDLVTHIVVRDKLLCSLHAAVLDKATVLGSINFHKLQTIEQVVEARTYMPAQAADEFMQLVKSYVKGADGLRCLAGIYRREGNLDAAMECYVAAAEYEGGTEAIADITSMFLERGDLVNAEIWGRKGALAAGMVVSGMLALQRLEDQKALECFKVAAGANDPRAMWLIGELLGSKPWFVRAASFGFGPAYESLGDKSKDEKNVNDFWKYKQLKDEYCSTGCRFTKRDAVADARVVAGLMRWRQASHASDLVDMESEVNAHASDLVDMESEVNAHASDFIDMESDAA